MRNGLLLLLITLVFSCKKDNTPPELILNSGAGYTSSDITLTAGSTFLVRMEMTKGKDDLSQYYTEVAYDGTNLPRLVSRNYIGPNDRTHFEKDITVTARNQPGTERWVFNVNDENGRISKREIHVTVQ
ncbi:hypothetical protein BH09BAC5_BH09BAC5_09890 [soil metagenome]